MRPREFLRGVAGLLMVGAQTRFRLRGAYWSWRRETAFGHASRPGVAQEWREALAYGAWAWKMRRFRRSGGSGPGAK